MGAGLGGGGAGTVGTTGEDGANVELGFGGKLVPY